MQGRFVAYYRVSTKRQGQSGLGLEAQQKAVRDYLNGGSWELAGEITEVESGRNSGRPRLAEALVLCRLYGATLIIAKIDRLTRDPDFLARIIQEVVEVRFCDLPQIEGPVGKFMLRQMLAVAELEAGLNSQRTKAALAAAKARGVKLGGDRGNLPAVAKKGSEAGVAARKAKARRKVTDLSPILGEMAGLSLNGMARELNRRGVSAPRGGKWTPTQVKRLIETAQGEVK